MEPISELIQSLDPESEVYIGPDKDAAEIVFIKPHRDRYLLSITDCESREQAEARRDQEIYLRADQGGELPEGTFYHWQIIGLPVRTEQGESLGVVRQIMVTGANDVYLVEEPSGKELLLPAIDQVIRRVDLEEGLIVVRLLPGLRSD